MDICMKEEDAAGAAAAAPETQSLSAANEATDASLDAPEAADAAADTPADAAADTAADTPADTAPEQQVTNEPAVSLHPLKISFYEAVAKQLLDDELNEVAVALCAAMQLRANPLLPADLLFNIYKAAAFQPTQEAAAAAAAATAAAAAQDLLLGRQPNKETTGGTQSSATEGAKGTAAAAAATTAAGEAAAGDEPATAEAATAAGTATETDPDADASEQQQQQQQVPHWQPLRNQPVPPITEGEHKYLFNPYGGHGGLHGGPPCSSDANGIGGGLSARITYSTFIQDVRRI